MIATRYKDQIEVLLYELDKSLEKEFILSDAKNNARLTSFSAGHPGVAMFYGYLYLYTNDDKYLDKCTSLIEKSLDYISGTDTTFTICNGIAGTAWTLQHLISINVIDAESTILNEFDEYLVKVGVNQISNGYYDYFHGGLGCGVYFLSRPNGNDYLRQLVDALDVSSISDEKGLYWRDYFSPRFSNDKSPRVNLGLAHGIPSIIFFLSKVLERDLSQQKVKNMLNRAVDYLMERSKSNDYQGCYFQETYFLDDQKPNSNVSRLAWCYGDLGVTCTLLNVSLTIGNKELYQTALDMALKTIERRDYKDTRINDGGLCHGLTGAVHIYHKLGKITQKSEFFYAANYWLESLMKYIENNEGISNFQEFYGPEQKFQVSHGFLMGSTGAGLTLLSLIDKKNEPSWDRFLLLS